MFLFQSGFVVLALLIAYASGLGAKTTWLGQDAGLWSAHWIGSGWGISLGGGIVLGGALFGLLLLMEQQEFAWLKRIDELLSQTLTQQLRQLNLVQLLLLATIAGIGEELCFRWAIQACLEWTLVARLPLAGAGWAWLLAAIVVSLTFGLLHAITPGYAIAVTIAGLIFATAAAFGLGIVGAIVAHALYDFLALLHLTGKLGRGPETRRADGEP